MAALGKLYEGLLKDEKVLSNNPYKAPTEIDQAGIFNKPKPASPLSLNALKNTMDRYNKPNQQSRLQSLTDRAIKHTAEMGHNGPNGQHVPAGSSAPYEHLQAAMSSANTDKSNAIKQLAGLYGAPAIVAGGTVIDQKYNEGKGVGAIKDIFEKLKDFIASKL